MTIVHANINAQGVVASGSNEGIMSVTHAHAGVYVINFVPNSVGTPVAVVSLTPYNDGSQPMHLSSVTVTASTDQVTVKIYFEGKPYNAPFSMIAIGRAAGTGG